jgi:hypothetical protein
VAHAAKRSKATAKRTSPTPRHPARRSITGIIGLVLASLLIAFVAGEVAVRLIYGSKYRPRPVFGVGDVRLGWKPSPHLDDRFYGSDFSMHIRTDADGYRLGKLGPVDYSKQLVVLLGDSYAFGWGLSTDDTFASHLDALIDLETGGTMRVVNLGVGGYGVLQSVDRLEEFFRVHPDARVQAVLVQHCVNDASDNFRSLGYHLGKWEVEPVERPRSPSHLLNLVAYARMLSDGRHATQTVAQARDADGADILWSVQRKGAVVNLPPRSTVGGEEVLIDASALRDNLEVENATGLTQPQRAITSGALNLLHETCAKRGIRVVHTFIATTPGWYVDEVSVLAMTSAEASGCRAMVTGTVPTEGGSGDSIRNAHSGGHFNAAFSRYWAQRMAYVLTDEGVLAK